MSRTKTQNSFDDIETQTSIIKQISLPVGSVTRADYATSLHDANMTTAPSVDLKFCSSEQFDWSGKSQKNFERIHTIPREGCIDNDWICDATVHNKNH